MEHEADVSIAAVRERLVRLEERFDVVIATLSTKADLVSEVGALDVRMPRVIREQAKLIADQIWRSSHGFLPSVRFGSRLSMSSLATRTLSLHHSRPARSTQGRY